MPDYIGFILSFLLALAVSLYFTPLFRKAALDFGIVDRPDGNLKKHEEAVPYLGGLAVFLSTVLALAFTYRFDRDVLAVLFAGAIIVVLGVVDDLGVLSPRVKLFGQIFAVVVLLRAGIYVKLGFLPPAAALVLSILWMILIINAFNIIDIMDGLASGVACISLTALAAVAYLNGRTMVTVMALAVAGSLLGFLRFNFFRAKIYLGDTGAMFLGLMTGALAMIGSYTGRTGGGHIRAASLAPIVILAVPLFDVLLVSVLRWKAGRPIMHGSPDHFALRLRARGWSVRKVVLMTYAATVVLSGSGLAMMWIPSEAGVLFLAGCLGLAGLAVGIWLARSPSVHPLENPEERAALNSRSEENVFVSDIKTDSGDSSSRTVVE